MVTGQGTCSRAGGCSQNHVPWQYNLIIKYVGDIMMVFKSIESQKDINYDEVQTTKIILLN